MSEGRLLVDERLNAIFVAACVTRGMDPETMLKGLVDGLLEEHQPEVAELLAD